MAAARQGTQVETTCIDVCCIVKLCLQGPSHQLWVEQLLHRCKKRVLHGETAHTRCSTVDCPCWCLGTHHVLHMPAILLPRRLRSHSGRGEEAQTAVHRESLLRI